MKVFELFNGVLPVLVSMPHNGMLIPESIAQDMTESALKVTDTDWYMDRIYEFVINLGCSVINPVYSRYVIDLNRPEDDHSLYPGADTTELCPTSQFDHSPLYLPGRNPGRDEVARRVEVYWRPYHQQLAGTLEKIRSEHGYALLFEAHSIKSVVPRFFEGQLADFNFGNNERRSCSYQLAELIDSWQPDGYSKVVNGRFKGGYITRHYGKPDNFIDSLQLELSQATYLDEKTLQYDSNKALQVIAVIENLFDKLIMYSTDRSANG